MNLKAKDFAFLKILHDADEPLTTRQTRELSESKKEVVSLNNDHINHRVYKFGDGNSQVTGKQMLNINKDSEATTTGSAPKVVSIKEERASEVEKVLDDSDVSESLEDFDNVQEAMKFFVQNSEATKQKAINNEEELEKVSGLSQELSDELEELKNENKELRKQVEENAEAIDVIRNKVRPLVQGMAKELKDKIGFNPSDYI